MLTVLLPVLSALAEGQAVPATQIDLGFTLRPWANLSQPYAVRTQIERRQAWIWARYSWTFAHCPGDGFRAGLAMESQSPLLVDALGWWAWDHELTLAVTPLPWLRVGVLGMLDMPVRGAAREMLYEDLGIGFTFDRAIYAGPYVAAGQSLQALPLELRGVLSAYRGVSAWGARMSSEGPGTDRDDNPYRSADYLGHGTSLYGEAILHHGAAQGGLELGLDATSASRFEKDLWGSVPVTVRPHLWLYLGVGF